jgi:6-phosphogluconolactonase
MSATQQICRWHILAGANELARTASTQILLAAQQAIARAGAFHLVLAGGSTPHRVYQALSQSTADWPHWHVWFGDERCLPAQDAERNSHMAAEAWLDRVPIPAAQIHPIAAELGAVNAANAYAQILAGLGDFDLVLLGLGEDGHTASLFPHHDWGTGATAPDVLAVCDAPKPPAERVSLSARRLAAAHKVIFLVSGAGKRAAVADWQAGATIPAAAIAPDCGVDVLLDFKV